MYLLADIGGTNTRLACATASGLLEDTVKSFRNSDFASFEAVLRDYLDNPVQFKSAAIALAGPVQGRKAPLTNLDWILDADALEEMLSAPVTLLNDLEAMGKAVADLGSDDLISLSPAETGGNGQALAVGIGTGMNVCAVKTGGTRTAWSCEYGHSPVPAPLGNALDDAGFGPLRIACCEDLFSGRGLAEFRAAGGTDRQYANYIGSVCSALTTQFMPMDGLFIAGGVARAILVEGRQQVFVEALKRALPPNLDCPPLYLITSDHAALKGCLAAITVN